MLKKRKGKKKLASTHRNGNVIIERFNVIKRKMMGEKSRKKERKKERVVLEVEQKDIVN